MQQSGQADSEKLAQLERAQLANRQRVMELNTDNDVLKQELETVKAEANRASESERKCAELEVGLSILLFLMVLKENVTFLKSEIENLTSQLNAEIAQSQERKKKIRVYVDKLTSDKQRLEEQLSEKSRDLSEVISSRDEALLQVSALTVRADTIKDQMELERSNHESAMREKDRQMAVKLAEATSEVKR